jgi:hypothetical protein
LATVLQAVQPEGRVVTIDIDSSHQIIPVLAEPGRNRTVENEGC